MQDSDSNSSAVKESLVYMSVDNEIQEEDLRFEGVSIAFIVLQFANGPTFLDLFMYGQYMFEKVRISKLSCEQLFFSVMIITRGPRSTKVTGDR